jgi:hypothetical protein
LISIYSKHMEVHSDRFGLMVDVYFPKWFGYPEVQDWTAEHSNRNGIMKEKDGRFVLEGVDL